MDESKYKNPYKVDYRELSDIDFIRNLDVLASNYYSDYIRGRAQFTGSIDSFMSRTSVDGCAASPYPLYPPRNVEIRGFFAKKIFFVLLSLLLVLFQIVYVALSFVVVDFWKDTLPFAADGRSISAPVMELILSSFSPENGLNSYLIGGGIILFFIGTILTFIFVLGALFSKRKSNGVLRRYRPTVWAVLSLVGLIACFVGSTLAGSNPGWGFILLGVATLLILLCSCFFYKKVTAVLPETYVGADGRVKEGIAVSDFIVR